MIETNALVKRYGETTALDGVSFSVAPGQIVGFLGPNGAGKTTALRILATYLTPDSGSARVAGHDVVRSPMEVRRRLGYLPEHPPLDLDHTVVEYLSFCAALRAVPRTRTRRTVAHVVERCGLGDVGGRLIGNLSKGFRQRVGLAQALVHDPEVILLDEPTIGLDPHQIVEIRGLIRALAGSHTVLLSSHILPEVAVTCDTVVIIDRGRVVASGSVQSLVSGGTLEDAFLRVTSSDLAAEAAREERV